MCIKSDSGVTSRLRSRKTKRVTVWRVFRKSSGGLYGWYNCVPWDSAGSKTCSNYEGINAFNDLESVVEWSKQWAPLEKAEGILVKMTAKMSDLTCAGYWGDGTRASTWEVLTMSKEEWKLANSKHPRLVKSVKK